MADTHQHQCGYHPRKKMNGCGFIWEHGDNKGGNKKAHRCPNCKRRTYWWYPYVPRLNVRAVVDNAIAARIGGSILMMFAIEHKQSRPHKMRANKYR